MQKPSWLFWVISVFALVWGAFGVFDFYMTTTGNEKYLQDFPPDMIGWIQGFPVWRKIIWALGVFSALIGPVLLLLRKKEGATALWFGVVMLLIGFIGHDLLLANGVEMYGQTGLIGSCVIVIISILVAWYASRAKSKGYIA